MDLVQEPNTIFLLPASSMNLVRLQFTAGSLNCFDIKTILPSGSLDVVMKFTFTVFPKQRNSCRTRN
jgi:hypothetical protein